MKENPVLEKSIAFALRIIKLYRYLVDEKKEYVLSKELLVAGTNIGKHVQEAINGESRPTFINEFGVARRKVSETEYWLLLLLRSELISEKQFESMDADREELARMISKIFATSKKDG